MKRGKLLIFGTYRDKDTEFEADVAEGGLIPFDDGLVEIKLDLRWRGRPSGEATLTIDADAITTLAKLHTNHIRRKEKHCD